MALPRNIFSHCAMESQPMVVIPVSSIGISLVFFDVAAQLIATGNRDFYLPVQVSEGYRLLISHTFGLTAHSLLPCGGEDNPAITSYNFWEQSKDWNVISLLLQELIDSLLCSSTLSCDYREQAMITYVSFI